MRAVVLEHGITSFKVFMAYKGAIMVGIFGSQSIGDLGGRVGNRDSPFEFRRPRFRNLRRMYKPKQCYRSVRANRIDEYLVLSFRRF